MTTICTFKDFRLTYGRKFILYLFFIFASSCDSKHRAGKKKYEPSLTENETHSRSKSESFNCENVSKNCKIEIYNNTSADSIIGEPNDSYQGYVKAKAWSNDGPYPPKFFDLKLLGLPICDSLCIEMNFRCADNKKNNLARNTTLFKKRLINKKSILIKNIDFQFIYNKHPTLQKIIFFIHAQQNGNSCIFEKEFALHEIEEITTD